MAITAAKQTPVTVPNSPFFHPSTPHVVVVQQTPGGTRRTAISQKQQQQHNEVAEHKSGVAGCVANLINAIVGAGIVGLPYAIQQAGFQAGLVLIFVCALITEKSLRLLIGTAKHVHVPSYETAAEATFGVAGFRFVAMSMFIMAYGAMLSYLIIVKDSFAMIFNVADDDFFRKRALLLMVSLCVMVPISCQRDMADLAKTSRVSVLIDFLLVGLVMYSAPIVESMSKLDADRNFGDNEGAVGTFWGGLWTTCRTDTVHFETISIGLGVLSFAYACQHSAFIIAGSLHKPTLARWSTVTQTAIMICCTLMFCMGVFGYLGYLADTKGNILLNLDRAGWTGQVARGLLGVSMLFVYPMESFVARHVCVVLLFSGRQAHEGEDAAILNRLDRRIGLTFFLYLLAVIPALLFDNLGSVLAATGVVGGSCLSYVGPGMIYLGVHGERFLQMLRESWLFGSIMPPAAPADQTDTSGRQQEMIGGEEPSGSEPTVDPCVLRLFKNCLWYLMGMPLWVLIANFGRKKLRVHIHDMALKSPHPIRIGDVEYRRAFVNKHGRIEDFDDYESSTFTLPTTGVMPPLGSSHHGNSSSSPDFQKLQQQEKTDSRPYKALTSDHAAKKIQGALASSVYRRSNSANAETSDIINARIGKNILEKQQQQQKETTKLLSNKKVAPKEETEPDPQEEPQWMDFFIAVFYIVFGLVAFFAGMVSLANS